MLLEDLEGGASTGDKVLGGNIEWEAKIKGSRDHFVEKVRKLGPQVLGGHTEATTTGKDDRGRSRRARRESEPQT